MNGDPDQPPIARFRADLAARIMRLGYAIVAVDTGDCAVPGCACGAGPYPYGYSVGLHRFDHPEIVMFGLPSAALSELGSVVHEAIVDDAPFAIGRRHRHRISDRLAITLDPVPRRWVERDPSRVACWFGQFGDRPAPAFVQVVWSDLRGRMPWDADADPAVRIAQPLLADDPIRAPRPPRATSRHRRAAG